ncbi:hypothetical protein BOTBODRAFT_225056 [Botryobasidium botryosum FD-172 SS1]|uniref:Uncharacterized protein n=1 Tax=Botryobasidium botryosum (strain FD-172 SS1) TaxID=930990 RepID=A0A067MQX0_BOTB1|nr:hypothetical protein BOTBODRAFT_225056 [Botryobasidium botryosum FD-172 SS1]
MAPRRAVAPGQGSDIYLSTFISSLFFPSSSEHRSSNPRLARNRRRTWIDAFVILPRRSSKRRWLATGSARGKCPHDDSLRVVKRARTVVGGRARSGGTGSSINPCTKIKAHRLSHYISINIPFASVDLFPHTIFLVNALFFRGISPAPIPTYVHAYVYSYIVDTLLACALRAGNVHRWEW